MVNVVETVGHFYITTTLTGVMEETSPYCIMSGCRIHNLI